MKRILVASCSTIPGYSGGWTTPLDLLEEDFQVQYFVAHSPSGNFVIEGIPVKSVSSGLRKKSTNSLMRRIRTKLFEYHYKAALGSFYRRNNPDLLIALDVPTALACISLKIPYVMRFHSDPAVFTEETLEKVVESSLFSTTTPSVSVKGAVEIPHNVNLDRFEYSEAPRAERAILVSTLNPMRRPMLFIEGVMMSSLKGAVVGTGPLVGRVRKACESSSGKIEYIDPVTRLELPELLSRFQIGVATYVRVPEIYQMKVNGYLATGLMTVVMPWTHLALKAPELTTTAETPEELAQRLDWIRDNWEETLDVRRSARKWVHSNYSIDISRRMFTEMLREHLGNDWI